jgi:hypothetical protein
MIHQHNINSIDYEWLLSQLTPNLKATRSNLRIDIRCLIKTTYKEIDKIITIIAELDKRYKPIIENDTQFPGHNQELTCLLNKKAPIITASYQDNGDRIIK